MNKILFVSRKVKDYTEKQMADLLGISEDNYLEIEHSLKSLNVEQAYKLAKVFDVPAELYIYAEGDLERFEENVSTELTQMIADQSFQRFPPEAYFKMITLGNSALKAVVDWKRIKQENCMLQSDNKALRHLNEELRKLAFPAA
jgi:transcriptional regulator with XRE-family HTH domain